MIISIHQPAYLPWLGYFNKIKNSDIFVFLDTVQFEKNSFVNRNKIKTSVGEKFLTIPINIKGHMSSSIKDIRIDNIQNWKNKHLKSIYINYKKAPYFEYIYSKLEQTYNIETENLSDFCYNQLLFWLSLVNINTKIIKSSSFITYSDNSDLIVEICDKFNANKYISGALGKNYLKEVDFEEKNITIEYQNYLHPSYNQLYGDFIERLSIVDFVMNSEDFCLI